MTDYFNDDTEEHAFLPGIALSHGLVAAIVYQHICWQCDNAKAQGRFVQLRLKDLCEKYPYLSRKQIWRALKALTVTDTKSKTTAIVDLVVKGADYQYRARTPLNREGAHYFNPNLAKELGVVPAIIYHNIAYWIKNNVDTRAHDVSEELAEAAVEHNVGALTAFSYYKALPAAYHCMKVANWAAEHYYTSESSAERGFRALVQVGLLEMTRNGSRVPKWSVPSKALDFYICKSLSDILLEDEQDFTVKREQLASKGNAHRQKETETGLKYRSGSMLQRPYQLGLCSFS